ncbi:MAG TPA: JAB domain-containing protein [Verrucomicrobiae bacterium]|nr:JAB domain-containing protein [Verrucomicrobiae bacterium]
MVHPMSVFRLAIVASAPACILAHNHPSGQPGPSEADIKVTRDLIRAGQLLKIEVLDHVILGTGNPGFCSLRELGFFCPQDHACAQSHGKVSPKSSPNKR